MKSLMGALSRYFPNVRAHCKGAEVYANLVWESGDPLPTEAQLNEAQLKNHKLVKIIELSQNCQDDIMSGFTSSALGSAHFYDSDELDQVNLIGAATTTAPTVAGDAGTSIHYAVRPIVDGVMQSKVYLSHTHAQLKQALTDGAQVKLSKLQKFNDKRNYLNDNVLTHDQINAVTWTSTP